jgi:hypothetical protein
MRTALVLLGFLASIPAHAGHRNAVVSYFKKAECKAETEEQRDFVAGALKDALNLSDKNFLKKSYPDLGMKGFEWDWAGVMHKYFEPADTGATITLVQAVRDRHAKPARKLLREWISKIQRSKLGASDRILTVGA